MTEYMSAPLLLLLPTHPHALFFFFLLSLLLSVTMENVSRFKGQEYCLHPRLQSTKNLVKWFKIMKDKHK